MRWISWRCQATALQTYICLAVGVLETTINQLITTYSQVVYQSSLDHSIIISASSSSSNCCSCTLTITLLSTVDVLLDSGCWHTSVYISVKHLRLTEKMTIWRIPVKDDVVFLFRREILHRDRKCVRFYNPGPKIWKGFFPKSCRSQNMQNLAQFRTTSKFGGEYLQNGYRYSKSDKYLIDRGSSHVWRWKFSEL